MLSLIWEKNRVSSFCLPYILFDANKKEQKK